MKNQRIQESLPQQNKKSSMIGLYIFGEKYVTEIEKNFSNLPRAGLKAFALWHERSPLTVISKLMAPLESH